ncbi:MAG: 16S rRNA (cytosine(1402)-N(4))-methyltransferase RsmH [Candidatus Cryosericum sp.]|mgnify:FL=1|nr:16S rRNA (cytosine(1402)-N(4))-methyltransferase RsmH [Candidatus Cryosericum sp.]HPS69617.1 16S rRNA (cytosine(1402)-N(4))-methyltransferase RsmH [Candidatus Cryosericum sp.]
MTGFVHTPVLLDEVMTYLQVRPDGTYMDCTTGEGGHAYEIGRQLSSEGTLFMMDVDAEVLAIARERLNSTAARKVIIRGNFRDMTRLLKDYSDTRFDGILMDLGFSSEQLAGTGKGLSFSHDQPLDMRLDDSLGTTARDIVNSFPEDTIADILWKYGEERRSRQVARAIVRRRQRAPIATTSELAETVAAVFPTRHARIHPATKTFQALRIYVNDELNALEAGLKSASSLLNLHGRLLVISYHSLEDRIVKRSYLALCEKPVSGEPGFRLVNKKVIRPSDAEVAVNRRSRSAKLRVLERVSS